MKTALLRQAGEALYGPRWQSALAKALGMSDRHMRRLAAGQADVNAGMTADLASLCRERAGSLGDLAERLDAAD